jgi:hypothetical protein
MADPNATLTRFPWKWETGKAANGDVTAGFITMKLGTYRYLFPQGTGEKPEDTFYSAKQIPEKQYKRHLYPGGPEITVTRKAKLTYRTRSLTATTAMSEKKLILSESSILGDSEDTIHYTGPTWACVAWLKKNCLIIDNGHVNIRGPHGQSYAALEPVPAAALQHHV